MDSCKQHLPTIASEHGSLRASRVADVINAWFPRMTRPFALMHVLTPTLCARLDRLATYASDVVKVCERIQRQCAHQL